MSVEHTVGPAGDGVEPSRRAMIRMVAEKNLILLKRYWFNTASGLAANYIMFIFIFFGARAAAPTVLEGNLSALIVGFLVWTMSWGAFQVPAQSLTSEAQWGTLEQLYMTPFGLFSVIAVRLVVRIGVTLVTGGIILVAMMATTGQWLHVDLLTVVPVAFLTMSTVAGIGFAFGGLALVYKRISNIFLIVQFLLLGAIGAPTDPAVLKLLPLTLGTNMLNEAMSGGVRLWEFALADLAVLVAVAAGYYVAGLFVMRYAVRVAQNRGIMGHY